MSLIILNLFCVALSSFMVGWSSNPAAKALNIFAATINFVIVLNFILTKA